MNDVLCSQCLAPVEQCACSVEPRAAHVDESARAFFAAVDAAHDVLLRAAWAHVFGAVARALLRGRGAARAKRGTRRRAKKQRRRARRARALPTEASS